MDTHGKRIILASNSPRRRELLAGLDIKFTVDTGTSFVEQYSPDTPHVKVPELMSEGKSSAFTESLRRMRFSSPPTLWYCVEQRSSASPTTGRTP